MIDLHIHTIFSDGHDTPAGIVKRAEKARIAVLAITDHDSVKGVAPAKAAAAATDSVRVVSGVEISAFEGKSDIHILGYNVDHLDTVFIAQLAHLRGLRKERARQIVARLNKLGLPLTFDDVLESANGAAVTRPHVATAMLRLGFVGNYREAFDRYLKKGLPAFVPHQTVSPKEAIDLIHKSGGIAVLAHPSVTGRDELIPGMVRDGLDGIEVWHPGHCLPAIKFCMRLAARYGIIATGGSDTHGKGVRSETLGTPQISYEVYESLQAASAVHKKTSVAPLAVAS